MVQAKSNRDVGFLIVILFMVALAIVSLLLPEPSQPKNEAGNLRQQYLWFLMYRNSHQQQWPPQNGQDFLIELWWDGVMEHEEKHARRFFSVAEPYEEHLAVMGMVAEKPIGDSLRQRLREYPESVTIVANATFAHRDRIFYMTGDGEVHSLLLDDLIANGSLTIDDVMMGIVPVGKSSPIEALRTVSNE